MNGFNSTVVCKKPSVIVLEINPIQYRITNNPLQTIFKCGGFFVITMGDL